LVPSVHLRRRDTYLTPRGSGGSRYSVSDLDTQFGQERILLGAEPGGGKTTVLAEVVERWLEAPDCLPAFVPMGLFDPVAPVIEQLAPQGVGVTQIEPLLEAGLFRIAFDGVNEVRGVTPDEVFEKLVEFMSRYPRNRYMFSCRTAEIPPWVHGDLTEISILPIAEAEVVRRLNELREELPPGSSRAVVLESHRLRLADMCRNPLMLSMLLILLAPEGEETGVTLEEIRSRSDIYGQFLRLLHHREQQKRSPTEAERSISLAARQEILAFIGFELQRAERVYAPAPMIEGWIATGLKTGRWNHLWGSQPPPLDVLCRSLTGRPPLKAVGYGTDLPSPLGFLHQSFGEYYAALFLGLGLERREIDHRGLRIYFQEGDRRFWEPIALLCGMSPEPEAVTTEISQTASEKKDQSLLKLAGLCLADGWRIPVANADDIRIRILDAFKYWEIPFDYDLMRAAKESMAAKSSGLPDRLTEDIAYFANKYAAVIPNELRNTDVKELFSLLGRDDERAAIDAAYTLGRRARVDPAVKSSAATALMDRLQSSSGLLREQIIAAATEVAVPAMLPSLIEITESPGETPRSRAFALNAIANTGEVGAWEVVASYLLNHANDYRDSASWSLQQLARHAPVEVLRDVTEVYLRALRSETKDERGRYACGNILYSLGVLGAHEHSEELIDWLEGCSDAYVLEDGINALGSLGGARAARFVEPFLESRDPAVRMKAADALYRLGATAAIPLLEGLQDDTYAIVRETARQALVSLSEGEALNLERFLDALRNPIREVDDEIVVELDEAGAADLGRLAEVLLRRGAIISRPKLVPSTTGVQAMMMSKTHAELLSAAESPESRVSKERDDRD
jgi:HEAT repeat protein